MHTCLDHEKLEVYKASLEFITWKNTNKSSGYGLSSPVYQRRKISPKNIQVIAPKAR